MIWAPISEEEWRFFEPFLVPPRKRGRGPRNHRVVLDAVFWVATFQVPWRRLPALFGRWTSVHSQFRRWCRTRVWDSMLRNLPTSSLPIDTIEKLRWSVLRAKQHNARGQLKNASRFSNGFVSQTIGDEEWAFIEPFLVEPRGSRGRPARDHRLVLNAVFWIAGSGAPWRALPPHFGKWMSVHRQFLRWSASGSWEAILDALDAREDLRPGGQNATGIAARDRAAELREVLSKVRAMTSRSRSRRQLP
jgi:transposase